VKALLDAKRKGSEIHRYTFEEKKEFDPAMIARAVVDRNMTMQSEQAHLQSIWESKPACRAIYRDDFQAFLEDVSREKIVLVSPPKPAVAPEIERVVPKAPPRAWPDGEIGYALAALRDAVLGAKRHFPNGAPLVRDLKWSKGPTPGLWAFFRYEDKAVTINSILNSPDVPLFVLEFLMFHEMLHADMPSAGHNRDFRLRERGYVPSSDAVADAERRRIAPSSNASADFWRVRADMFLDTFHRFYATGKLGKAMDF
jgi:hypothetical protein